jgi:hypothetical protein
VAHNVSDAFGLNLNVDYIKLDAAHAIGVAAMARYVASEHLALALRGEFLSDKGILLGSTSATEAETIFEGTVGAAFPFAGHFEARAELRGDFAKDAIYPGAVGGSKNQTTGTIAFLGFM